MSKLIAGITFALIVLVLIGMYNPFREQINESRLKENRCLEEEIYWYRLDSGFLFTSKFETTEENADNFDYRCILWEEEPSFGASILGQELIHKKGTLSKEEQRA